MRPTNKRLLPLLLVLVVADMFFGPESILTIIVLLINIVCVASMLVYVWFE